MSKLRVLELFAGTRSIGKAFEEHGHEVTSIDWDDQFTDCIHTNAYEFLFNNYGGYDVVWASPDCTTYSMAGRSVHRLPGYVPKTDYAKYCDTNNLKMFYYLSTLSDLKKIVFVENPMGMMRKMEWAKSIPRYTVTLCQYGDKRMKPTDIWTNHPSPEFKPMCKNGDPCHERAPRGSHTGTQGLKTAKDRAKLPKQLCEHIVKISEQYYRC